MVVTPKVPDAPLAAFDLATLLKEKSALITRTLPHLLPDPSSATRPGVKRLFEMEWECFNRGGKRLRPTLCLLSCEMLGGKEEDALPTAGAIEILQNFFLIHDDIEDESELRRGKPCLHLMHGIPLSINAGDALFVHVWKTLADNKQRLGASTSFKVMREFIRQCNYTVEGQAMEIDWTRANAFDLTEDDYYDLVTRKTAHYTITTPLRIGALIAGADKRTVDSFDAFGLKLGIAFQIHDDVLNLQSTQQTLGKEAAGDLYEGKRTLVLLHALKKAKQSTRERMLSTLNKSRKEKTEEDVQFLMQCITETESIAYATAKAHAFSSQALALFEKKFAHVPESKAKTAIRSIISFAVQRTH